jgi:hypothetical protein
MRIQLITFFAFLMSACSGDDPEEQLTLPSNLVVQTVINPDGSGQVSVTALATNANFYSIYFGETTGENPVKANDGKATHTYEASGSYTIRVQAHVTTDAFISESSTISVTLKEDEGITIPTEGYTTPEAYDGMALVWQDEFSGTSLNAENWTFETGTGTNGWGNNELQYYRQDNTMLQDGYLVISAKKELFQGRDYTSSRIITKDKKSFKYGRVDIRAVLPEGQGIWPALWMLGSNISTVQWPACGEIDIMEMIGGSGREKTVHGTLHWDDGGRVSSGKDYSLATGTFADKFHVFSIVWNETSITWYMDDIQYSVIDTTPATLSEFQNSFFFIFNVAVGGDWPGAPNSSTEFPQHMIVDYIRVFQ